MSPAQEPEGADEIRGRREIPVRCSGGHHDPRGATDLLPDPARPGRRALRARAADRGARELGAGRRGARAARPRGPGPDHAVLEVVRLGGNGRGGLRRARRGGRARGRDRVLDRRHTGPLPGQSQGRGAAGSDGAFPGDSLHRAHPRSANFLPPPPGAAHPRPAAPASGRPRPGDETVGGRDRPLPNLQPARGAQARSS